METNTKKFIAEKFKTVYEDLQLQLGHCQRTGNVTDGSRTKKNTGGVLRNEDVMSTIALINLSRKSRIPQTIAVGCL